MGERDTNEFLSTLYHSLRSSRRRRTIVLVHQADSSTLPVRELSRTIGAAEHETARERVSGKPYRNMYNSLSQTHLPTLADAEIIDYDSERQTVAAGRHLTLAALLVTINRPAVDTLYGMRSDGTGDSDADQ